MSSISHFSNKIKGLQASKKAFIFNVFTIILVALGAFYLGQIYEANKAIEPKVQISVANTMDYSVDTTSNSPSRTDNSSYVASKNGKLYYRVGCGASTRILDKNKVYFSNTTDAESAGFEPSASCTP